MASLVVGAIGGALGDSAAAGLGDAVARSALGQPLSVAVPVLLRDGESFDPSCIRIVSPRDDEGLPVVRDARLGLENRGGATWAVVSQPRNNNEPAVKLALELGCVERLRREYTLLFDPPDDGGRTQRTAAVVAAPTLAPIELPQVARLPEPSVAPVAPSANVAAPMFTPVEAQAKRPRSRSTTAASLARVPRPAISGSDGLRLSGAIGMSSAAARVALAAPQLKLSGDLTAGPASALDSSDALQRELFDARRKRLQLAPPEQDLTNSIEIEWVVAQKRLAEMQARLNVAQSNLQAKIDHSSNSKEVASSATTSAPPPAVVADVKPTSTSSRKIPQSEPAAANAASAQLMSRLYAWLWVPFLLAVASLGAYLLWRFSRRNSVSGDGPEVSRSLSNEFVEDATLQSVAPTADGTLPAPLPPENTIDGGARGGRFSTFGMDTTEVHRVASGEDVLGPHTRLPLTTIKGPGPLASELTSDFFHPKEHVENMGVHEISAVTEEASVYIELGRIPEAIAILNDHITLERAYQRATPAPWLMLLDLHYRNGNHNEFETLRGDFAKVFNGTIPSWNDYASVGSLKSLEQHEHIIDRIVHYWGTPKCRVYIETLLYDNRGGSRVGFSLTAYRELVLLMSIHDAAFGLAASGAPTSALKAPPAVTIPTMAPDDGTLEWVSTDRQENTLSPEMPRTIRRIQKHPRH